MSEMSKEELKIEMQRLWALAKKKEQAGFFSEANVLEQKFYMAKSYLMDPNQIEIGGQYRVAGEEGIFTVRYLNGVFAWGKLDTDPEERGFPIGRLEKL
jgi:hypothetical protein